MKKLGTAALLLFNLPEVSATTSNEVEQLRMELRKSQEALQSRDEQIKALQDKLVAANSKTADSGAVERSASPSSKDRNVLPLELDENTVTNAPTKPKTWKDDFTVAVGTKVWLTEWTTSLDNGGNGIVNNDIMSIKDNNNQAQPIATATLKYKDFMAFGSYVSNTDYSFPTQIHSTHANGQFYDTTETLRGTRTEWDVNLGYQVHKYLAMTVGYKEIQQSLKSVCSTSVYSDDLNEPTTENCSAYLKATYAGPTLGGAFSVPIGKGFGTYGQFAYGWLDANASVGSTEIDSVDYYIAELGMLYSHSLKDFPVSVPLTAATVFAGYRMQSYDIHAKNAPNDSPNNDLVKGFVSGVNFAF